MERLQLISLIRNSGDWAQAAFRNHAPSNNGRHRKDILLDLGSQISQAEEARQLARINSDFSGQRISSEAGIQHQSSLEFQCLLEDGLDARRLRLSGALSENCKVGLKSRIIDYLLATLRRENYPEFRVMPQNKGLFQFSLVFVQRR